MSQDLTNVLLMVLVLGSVACTYICALALAQILKISLVLRISLVLSTLWLVLLGFSNGLNFRFLPNTDVVQTFSVLFTFLTLPACLIVTVLKARGLTRQRQDIRQVFE